VSASAASIPGSRVSAIDRRGAERDVPELLSTVRSDPAARVVAVRRDTVPTDEAGALRFLRTEDVPERADWGFLGRTADGAPVLVAAIPDDAAGDGGGDAGLPGLSWSSLRLVAAQFDRADAEWAVEAVSLARWLGDARFCSFCGARTDLAQAGWSRHCPSCGRQHFPRTDPAVIVAVTDPAADRILLGANAAWPQGRYSCFAGFAEAGESLEAAVEREVAEEAGVQVEDAEYQGSQPWPYPRSLMLGFRAVASDPDEARADGEEIAEVRWFTRDQIADALKGRGDVTLPGPSSIAHRLIVQWHGERP
jgi:NAD+ diphosphatase